MRHIFPVILILAALSLAFYWGYGSHKNRTFPYSLLENGSGQPARSASAEAQALRTLGYAMGSPTSDKSQPAGVTVNYTAKTSPALNLYNSVDRDNAVLFGMNGETVRSWTLGSDAKWQYVERSADGGIFAIEEGSRLIRLSPESDLVWEFDARVHHDLCEFPDGRVFVLTKKKEAHPEMRDTALYDIDYVTELSPDGKFLKEVSVLDMLRNTGYGYLVPTSKLSQNDIFHANTIEVFDGSLEHLSTMFRKGNWLLSLRNIDFIFIYDPEKNEIVWGWGPSDLYRQHHPSLLDNGNILVFDNGMKISRVLEVDPATYKVVWRYGGEPDTFFFSPTRGSAQRLSDGNTLITVADEGYAIEVTRSGEVVWKFVNPDTFVDDKGNEMRASLYRLSRYER